MFTKGVCYNVISEKGVYAATINAQTDKEIDLLQRLSTIAKIEEVKPNVKFAYH